MSQLVWKPVGFISSNSTITVSVKMEDDTDMTAHQEGIEFINAFDGINRLRVTNFKYALGLGNSDISFQEMWMGYQNYAGTVFKSLGNGSGVAGVPTQLPYYIKQDSFSISADVKSIYWKQVNMEAYVEFDIQSEKFSNTLDCVSGFINNEIGSSYVNNNIGLSFGEASFTNYTDSNQAIPSSIIDKQDILISFKLQILDSENQTLVTTECFNSNTISQGILHNTREAFMPVKFLNRLLNFNIDAVFGQPSNPQQSYNNQVNEGEIRQIEATLFPNDYIGNISVYLLDNVSKDNVVQAIGDDLTLINRPINDNIVAQYGELFFSFVGNPKEANGNISTISPAEFEYHARLVNSSQTDNFSFIIRKNEIDLDAYDDSIAAQEQYAIYSQNLANKYHIYDQLLMQVLNVNYEIIDVEPSNNLIQQPTDIMYHLLASELGMPLETININSIIEARKNNQINLAFSIFKETEAKKILTDIAFNSTTIPRFLNGKLDFISTKLTYRGGSQYYDDDTAEIVSVVKSDDILNYSFTRTDIENINTKLQLKFDKDYGRSDYNKITDDYIVNNNYFKNGTYGDLVAGTLQNNNYYGVDYDEIADIIQHKKTLKIYQTDYIKDRSSANYLANYLFKNNINQHNIIEIDLPLKYYNLTNGDLIEFDKMILNKKVYGESYVIKSVEDMPIRAGQFILPLFMIIETKKSLKNVKLKAIQLHHLSDDDLNYKGNIYSFNDAPVPDPFDTNNDGSVNVLDVVTLVNSVINQDDYDEKKDVNGDGSVDVLDVVATVTRILNEG
tara:strand:+ start:7065 stop:9425 length:2361 start_codon:yes stop_codon:yes gene_type:complete